MNQPKPIATFQYAQAAGIELYDIEYGIEQYAIWGYFPHDGKIHRSKIHDNMKFRAGKQTFSLDDFMRTNI